MPIDIRHIEITLEEHLCLICFFSIFLPLFIILLSVTKEMTLLPSAGSDRAWVWTVQADFADEEPKVEQLAIRFKNAESELEYFTLES